MGKTNIMLARRVYGGGGRPRHRHRSQHKTLRLGPHAGRQLALLARDFVARRSTTTDDRIPPANDRNPPANNSNPPANDGNPPANDRNPQPARQRHQPARQRPQPAASGHSISVRAPATPPPPPPHLPPPLMRCDLAPPASAHAPAPAAPTNSSPLPPPAPAPAPIPADRTEGSIAALTLSTSPCTDPIRSPTACPGCAARHRLPPGQLCAGCVTGLQDLFL